MTTSITDKLKEGMTPGDAAKALEQAGADIVGVNCWQDPTFMLPVVEEMRAAVGCCGCQGSHIRQMAKAPGKMPAEEREWAIDYERPQSATGAYHHMRQ